MSQKICNSGDDDVDETLDVFSSEMEDGTDDSVLEEEIEDDNALFVLDDSSIFMEDQEKQCSKRKYDDFYISNLVADGKRHAGAESPHSKHDLGASPPTDKIVVCPPVDTAASPTEPQSVDILHSEQVATNLRKALSLQHNRNVELQSEIKKLKKDVSRLKKEKSNLQANLAAYASSLQVTHTTALFIARLGKNVLVLQMFLQAISVHLVMSRVHLFSKSSCGCRSS
ncbi:hypothetical protein ACA910_008439 [Epithemia clementina (nom. ined.)]